MSAVSELLLATNNSKKLTEIRAILGELIPGRILCAADFPDVEEPEETGTTFEENARLKADHYTRATGIPALADDSGLVVDSLDGRPGVYSARYASTDAERIARLLREMEGVEPHQRTARFVCAICLALPDGTYIEERGTLEGSIGFSPKGTFGFGYDPVFLVRGTDNTLAEISAETKNEISHRGTALTALRKRLADLVKTQK